MTYFRELPNVEYQNFLASKSGSQDYLLMKNIFIRGKLRDDLQNVFTLFNKYVISENERPDQIAFNEYGDPGLDWVVLVTANIINYQNQYPLNSQQLWTYVNEKYGPEYVNDIRYYVTTEVKDQYKKLILPPNLVVDQNFTIPNPDIPGGATLNPTAGVSNWEYENDKNDRKKTIYVLKREYLNQFLNDMQDLSTYGFNSEFIDNKTIRVANTINKNP